MRDEWWPMAVRKMNASKRRTALTVHSLVSGFVAILALGGCGDVEINGPDWKWDGDFTWVQNTDFSAQATFRYSIAAKATLSLTATGGSIEIVGDPSANSITVEGVRRVRSESISDARARLDDLQVQLSESSAALEVRTLQPQRTQGRRYEVDYRIALPDDTDLTIQQVSGPIAVSTLRGDVGIHSVSGSVRLDELESSVRAVLAAGDIDASLILPVNGVVDLTNNAGGISLSIPKETSASLQATTVVGAVRVEGLDLTDEDPRPLVLVCTMSDGDGTIRLATVTGDITVKAR